MNRDEVKKQIDEFEAHYQYDSTYMRDLLEYSPEGLAKFNQFLPLARHRELLAPEEYWVAKLAAVQVEDCGHCLQLNVRMALEAGVPKHIIEAAIKGGELLPDDLKDVYAFAKSVADHDAVDPDLLGRIESRYNKGQLLEFGLNIAAAKVFPTIKRAAGYITSCHLVDIAV